MGYFKTAVLLSAMTALFLSVGFLLGGQSGMMTALIFALGMNFFAYWNSDKMLLRMFDAKEVAADSPYPDLRDYYKIVEQLSKRANLPMPKVYVLDNAQPNAFATGRNPENAAVAASMGLINILNKNELAGVMAHELTHIKHRDTLIMTITATFAGAIGMIANFAMFFGRNRNNALGGFGSILVMILSPIAAMLVQMAISRSREYEADYGGAMICGQPLDLASALEKLQLASRKITNVAAERHPAAAHLFIVNPLQGQRMDNLFSTHPNMDNRIKRLQAMAGDMMGRHEESSAYPKPKARDSSRYGSEGRYRSDEVGRSSVPKSGPRSGSVKESGQNKKGPWG